MIFLRLSPVDEQADVCRRCFRCVDPAAEKDAPAAILRGAGQKDAVLSGKLLKAKADDQIIRAEPVDVLKQLRSSGGHEENVLAEAVQAEMQKLGQTAGASFTVQKDPLCRRDLLRGLFKGFSVDQLQRFLQAGLLPGKKRVQSAALIARQGALQLFRRPCPTQGSGDGRLQFLIVPVSRVLSQPGKGGIGDAKPLCKLGNGSRQEGSGIPADEVDDLLFCFGIAGRLLKKNIGKHGNSFYS